MAVASVAWNPLDEHAGDGDGSSTANRASDTEIRVASDTLGRSTGTLHWTAVALITVPGAISNG